MDCGNRVSDGPVSARRRRSRSLLLLGLLLAAEPAGAVSTYKGVQPGKTTRAEVEKIFGQPRRALSGTLFEYALTDGPGELLVEYREAGVVNRLERQFPRAISRAALRQALELPEAAEATATRDGKLVEYFGDIKTLALSYTAADTTSGVISLGYHSMESFAKLVDKAHNPTVSFNPAACRDLYAWAQREVRQSGLKPVRKAQIYEIMTTAQRGECTAARKTLEGYTKQYGVTAPPARP